ncbi:MAG TPA: OB-fold nucleic acid binding domain-containing protein, partial [Thermomicrobiales bacterium]|nr:OB-fold nucleic acid binding domain-containing protein [Thermomicrobiales bacterium]
HPVAFFRAELDRLGVVPAERLVDMAHGQELSVAGLVLVRQRPGTARGVTFVTLEDETGIINLIVRLDVWKRHYRVARTASAFLARGRLQKQHDVIHLLVSELENMAGAVNELRSQSRDFR